MRGLKLLASLVRATPDVSLWSWATVTDDSPLRVQLDGEDAALDVTPDTLVSPLSVDDRVWVQLVTNDNPTRRFRRLVVHGRGGGDQVPAGPPAAVKDTQGSNGTTTSTSFTDTLTTSPGAGVAFVAPTSGRVVIHNVARMANSAANETYCGFHVRTDASVGAGSDVLVAADERSIIHVGTSVERAGTSYLLTGLTPGSDYNVVQSFRVSGGTGTYAYRSLTVAPTT
jgi:hypothetical protein